MSRERIANFLTAERTVTPLTAFSLLITAGFIAGSLQIVGPRQTDTYALTTPPPNQQAMLAQAVAPVTAPTATKYDSPAPDSCTEAIKAALGKQQGPEVTSTDKGQNGTVDACFGGVLNEAVSQGPSMNPAVYKCVGRSGKVTITADSAIGKTKPDASVPMGQCKVQVCQPYMGAYGNIVPNCSDPKQLGAGQGTGVPPPMPAGATPAPAPSAPAPSGSGAGSPLPNEILKATNGQAPEGATTVSPTGEKTYELKDGVYMEVNKDGQTRVVDDNTGNIANLKEGETVEQALQRMANGQSDENFQGNALTTKSDVGALLNDGLKDEGVGLYPPPRAPCDNPLSCDPVVSTDAQANDSSRYQPGTTFGGAVESDDYCWKNPGACTAKVSTTSEEPKGFFGRTWDSIKESYNESAIKRRVTAVSDFFTGNDSSEAARGVGSGVVTTDPPLSDGPVAPSAPTDMPASTGRSAEDDMRASEQFPVEPATDQPGVGDYCAKNPGACIDANGKPISPGIYPGTDQPGIGPNGKPITYIPPAIPTPKPADVPKPVVPPPGGPITGPGGGAPTGGAPTGGGSSSGAMKGLTSFLGGLMKGMGGMLGAQQPQQQGSTCPTDQQAYAQYQQQYNQQLQQYNYQLQQYNYQQQQNAQYGYSSYAQPQPPQPPRPCSPGSGAATGGGAGVGGVCQPLPAQPNVATCPVGTWRQMTTSLPNGAVCPVWQCVAATSTTPTAQLTCSPGVVESGTRVHISYTCTNSQTSTGYGFVTGGATSGATSTVIDAPANASGMNFALKCESGALSAASQCSVQIAKVSIALRSVPEQVREGEPALIGWVTTGMQSCTVSSPDQPDFTARSTSVKMTSGIATSSPITGPSDFYLNCTTVTGEAREEKISINPYSPGTVTSSVANRTNVARGTTATIQWSFPSAPDVSAVALWLYSVEDERTVALILGRRAKAGTYTWNIPNADEPCNTSSSLVCGSDMIPGRTYTILASLYTPPNASLGEFNDPSLPEPVFLDNPSTETFKFAQ